ncbi:MULTISPECIES: ABC transporter ATP-binding protein [Methylomonas]|uniref:Macrolide ABC transporter ATP-binding protein n=2 Tax=Methylomonas TaxID=416 RepID=A0A126T4Y3_9GAMM|nr:MULTISPECIES: ABC transporter ATP-binding protein [Methylomonas]AMK76784.1 macrolide ABC transporter ATP-binding protein [Methylomonas denitrificans]OAH96358.1 macrolide ABC transporter ATP-binding protein [Methylomonas methanica]TCV75221.1 putative ABC transport system ATP-binding protein [Methylomonas methanica]
MIQLSGIRREFQVGEQTVQALNGIDLSIGRGEYVSVMGPSGSGKSTLLNIVALLDQPSAGQYLLNGTDVTRQSDDELARIRRDNIGFVFQFFHLIPRLTAAENIEMPMILAGIDSKQRKQRVLQALASVNLLDRAEHKPNQLSGGQLQRIAIARAMIMQPGILLADEPTGNLDSKSGQDIIELLENLNRQGVTLIIITHDQNIGGRAKRQLRIVDGRLAGGAA